MSNQDSVFYEPTVEIPDEWLVALASRIYERIFKKQGENGRVVSHHSGSYNIAYIIQFEDGFKLVIRAPVTGKDSFKNGVAARAFESTVSTMRLVAERTSIPVPQVYDFDTTDNNEIQNPYMCLSFVPGKPVSEIWFKGTGTLSLTQLRHNILRNLAQVMAKFSHFTFNQIGSIPGGGSCSQSLDPCYDCRYDEDGSFEVVASGPFNSVSEYLAHHFQEDVREEYGRGCTEILNLALPALVSTDSPDSPEEFVLRPPDFDSQNVMVDDQGNITGLIDWDLAQTMPRNMGYAKFPAWLTRDWDPIMYFWPVDAEIEDSPMTLKAYRWQYARYLGEALNWKGDWKFTSRSHLTEAVWISAHNTINRTEICRKLVEEAVDEKDANGLMILFEMGGDYLKEEDWDKVRNGMKRLFLSQVV